MDPYKLRQAIDDHVTGAGWANALSEFAEAYADSVDPDSKVQLAIDDACNNLYRIRRQNT